MWCRRVVNICIVFAVVLCPITNCFFSTNSLDIIRVNGTNALRTINSELVEESRKKKKKNEYLVALILGAVLVKLILFPIAVKAMAVMSSISVLISSLSLIMSSIVGYSKFGHRKHEPTIKLVHINDGWSKGDEVPNEYIPPDSMEYGPNIPLEQYHYSIK